MNLSIKNVPEDIVEPLRIRARRNHRSLQGELVAILEQAVAPSRLTVKEAQRQLSGLAFHTDSDSQRMIRQDRDGR